MQNQTQNLLDAFELCVRRDATGAAGETDWLTARGRLLEHINALLRQCGRAGVTKTCGNCGAEFSAGAAGGRRSDSRFCSEKCRKASHYRLRSNQV